MARPVQVSLSLLLVVVVALFAAAEVAAQGTCSASSPCPATTNCCSQYGYCGTGAAYCGTGCKSGPCTGTARPPPPPPPTAQSGSCSASSPCPAATNCCSQYGYCGTGAAYCGTGCKSGPCTGTAPPPPPPPPTAQSGSCSASSPCPAATNCCSQYGYCGTGAAYCGTGCKNGPCTGTAPPPPPPSPPLSPPPSPPPSPPLSPPPPPPPTAQSGSCSASSPCPAATNCCSQYGYCGTGAAYCGTGCKNGPCTSTPTPTPPSSPGGTGWSSFFNQSDFNSWFPNRNSFYTFQAFSDATSAYSAFGTTGSTDDQKREIAAFFGNVQQESGGLVYINEINPPNNYCQANNAQYPCAAGKSYYGRGPIQLSWNYNYGACGDALGLNLLANPDQVAQNGGTAFKTALWFWMTSGCHEAILQPSFASTNRIINSIECGHGFDQRVENRVNAYVKFCGTLQVDPGTDLRC